MLSVLAFPRNHVWAALLLQGFLVRFSRRELGAVMCPAFDAAV